MANCVKPWVPIHPRRHLTLMRRRYSGRCYLNKLLGLVAPRIMVLNAPKTRLTALVGANMDGSEKYPLLVIGKFKNPRAFKNVAHLPLNYDHNKKAWMTGKIFIPFMRKMNNQFKAQKQQVAIIPDNCSAHPPAELTDFSNIKFFSHYRLTQHQQVNLWTQESSKIWKSSTKKNWPC